MQKTNVASPTLQQGLVISYFGNRVAVENAQGEIIPCHLHRNQTLPVVGDQVMWQRENNEQGVIMQINPRRSLLTRGDHKGNVKPIAANIEAIFIVMAPPPIFSEYLLDRYLVAAALVNIPAVIVVNKLDLLNEKTLAALQTRLQPFLAVPYPVILSSVYNKAGLTALSQQLQGKRAVLVGPSGAGKSSIIAALSSHPTIPIGKVTEKGAGKHTTTATRLYHLTAGGELIDSPGVREFNLWKVSKEEILRGFPEINAYLGQCKFRDCQHDVEPQCAVKNAVNAGKISAQRLASYHKLLKMT